MRSETQDGILRVSISWRTADSLMLGAFTAVWIALAFWFIAHPQNPAELVAGALLAVIGMPLAWLALAVLVNRTIIEASSTKIAVRHGPIPWPRPRPIQTQHLLQLYVELRQFGLRCGPLARLRATMEDGQRPALTWLLRGRRAEWAFWIEKQIELHLGIVNRPIVCPKCSYDLRVTLRRCPECGWRLGGNKRQRRAWAEQVRKITSRKGEA